MFLRFSTCCFRVYSRGLKTLNSVGRCNFIKFRINSLIPLEKRLKSLLLSKLFLRCIPSAFPGLKRIKLKQLKICCSLRQSPKTASCFEFASEASSQSLPTFGIIWTFYRLLHLQYGMCTSEPELWVSVSNSCPDS